MSASHPKGEAKRVTLKDLSKHLGLSTATISLVLNNSPHASSIAEDTRERIIRAARQYNYKPNYFAKYLNQRRSYLIGVISPDMAEGYVAELLSGIEERLLQSEYQFFVASHQWSKERIRKTTELFLERGADGVILINTDPVTEVSIPLVNIGFSAGGHGTSILIDNLEGIRKALEHLVTLGHRKIAFMKGHKGSADTERRWAAFRETAKKLSIPVDPKLVVQLEKLGSQQAAAIEEGELATQKLLSASRDFTALLAFNDITAVGAMHAFGAAHMRIPEDVSIIGFDDAAAARIAYPMLTTVRQPLREMGDRAAENVIAQIENREAPHRIVFEPDLVVRSSTGACPRSERTKKTG